MLGVQNHFKKIHLISPQKKDKDRYKGPPWATATMSCKPGPKHRTYGKIMKNPTRKEGKEHQKIPDL